MELPMVTTHVFVVDPDWASWAGVGESLGVGQAGGQAHDIWSEQFGLRQRPAEQIN